MGRPDQFDADRDHIQGLPLRRVDLADVGELFFGSPGD